MSNIVCDADTWRHYPQHRWVFDKLALSEKLGYYCGPGGVSVVEHGTYIVRPTYNLSGMGVNARKMELFPEDYRAVAPGEFWCEWFNGYHYSIDYTWELSGGEKVLKPIFACQGYRTSPDLYRFNAWRKITPPIWELPEWINTFHDVPVFNIEFIGDRIIEIHLRSGNDFPEGATEIIPVWGDAELSTYDYFEKHGYTYKFDFDDADGHLPVTREGIFYR